MKHINIYGVTFVFILGILSMFGSQSSPSSSTSSPSPVFTAFEVNPGIVCLNTSIPLVQVNYTFDPDGWSNPNTLCTQIMANGVTVHPEIRHQCLDDGTSGSYTFNLTEVFGGNVPSEVTVQVELLPLVAGDVYDTRAATITTRVDCLPPGGLPNP